MIAYLSGTVLESNFESVIILIDGKIGYQVFLTSSNLAQIKTKQKIELFCYHHITDRSQSLYGFLTLKEKHFFQLLINNVSGIGPKLGLKFLDKVNFKTVKQALAKGDAKILEQHGVTRKKAEKIIISLKGKISGIEEVALKQKTSPKAVKEAMQGLINLGYQKKEIQEALSKIKINKKNTQEIIKQALKKL